METCICVLPGGGSGCTRGKRKKLREDGLSPQESDALMVHHFNSLSNMALKIRALFVMHVLGTSAFSQLENHYIDLAMRYVECILILSP